MMPAPPPLPSCPTCQSALDPNGTCPRCRASDDWNDQIDALDFVIRRLRDWQASGQLTERQVQSLTEPYLKRQESMRAAQNAGEVWRRDPDFPPRDECWSCGDRLVKAGSHCEECGAPVEAPAVKSLRYWRFLLRELRAHEDSGWLALRQAHEMIGEVKQNIAGLKQKLERDRAPYVTPVEVEGRSRRPARADEATISRRSFLEAILDPQSIQWLLAAGGVLIAVGLVIWLVSLGILEQPGYAAIALGFGNGVLLLGGWALMLKTRYQMAGRALTLLACLLMPLNLWFYHAHKLMTVSDGLWIPALVCCLLYTASAWILKDSLFVYVLVGGVTLTGLLILGEIERFGEILAPSIFLVGLGLLCMHAERAFQPGEGPFARQRFGLAFFWSAHALFAVGLLLLMAAQIIGWLHEPLFRHFGLREPPDVAKRDFLPWTLGIVLAGTYAYLYSDFIVRRKGVYIYLAAITILWAEIHVLILIDLAKVQSIVIITLSMTAIVFNLLHVAFRENREFLRFVPPLGMMLSLIPVGMGVLLHCRAVSAGFKELWPFELEWDYVAAMLVTALCCRVGAYLYRHTDKEVSTAYFFLTMAATLAFAAGLIWMLGVKPWEEEAPILMLIPIAYLAAAKLYRGHSPEKPLILVAHVATGLMIYSSITSALGITAQVVQPVQGRLFNLLLAEFCLEAAAFYVFASILQRGQVSMCFAAIMLCGAIWQVLQFFEVYSEIYVVAYALTGVVLLTIYRMGVFEHMDAPLLDRAIFQAANAFATLGAFTAAVLAMHRWGASEIELRNLRGEVAHALWLMIVLLGLLVVVSIVSAVLVRHSGWRRAYIVFAVIEAVLIALLVHRLLHLNPWQAIEYATVGIGVFLVSFAYFGWYRETERINENVSLGFAFGSLAIVVPLFLASAIHRFGFDISLRDELGLLAACILLFGSGVVCRIRATTLAGGVTMLLYLAMLLIYMHRFLKETVIIGIYLTLGGVVLFGSGLILSVYRDRLLKLSDRFRRREGIFRVFEWR